MDWDENSGAEGDRLLLQAVIRLGPVTTIEDLVRGLGGVLGSLPSACYCGITTLDAEREVYETVELPGIAEALDTPPVCRTDRQTQEDQPDFGGSRCVRGTGDSAAGRRTQWDVRLSEFGVHTWIAAPIAPAGRWLGQLSVGFDHADAAGESIESFVGRLADIVTPMVMNCLNAQRFSRGDLRRDTIIELTNAINSSLDRATILRSAQPLIARFEEHCLSGIALLEESPKTYRWYPYRERGDSIASTTGEPQSHVVAGGWLAWLIENGRTFESENLTERTRFAEDEALRLEGVRRYVASPLFARGRIIGGFLFGSADPSPTRRIDIWLYENIATQLGLAIDNAMQHAQLERLSDRLRQHNVYLQQEIDSQFNFSEMVGESSAMATVRKDIERVAKTEATVLITGETGVGKELVARAIHAGSARSDQPMVKVNCAAIPEGMVESELFGHERGAFTSAVERRIGRFELSTGGTLFLDEIGELPIAIQPKLLRVLQDGEFERVGGAKTLVSNARIIVATNRDLLAAVDKGRFRADLYYRLNVFPIAIPSLAARREDIEPLVQSFIEHFNRRMGRHVRSLDPRSLAYLQRRDWPGNVRELRHVIERAMILCDGEHLSVQEAPSPAGARVTESETSVQSASLRDMEAQHIRDALRKSGGTISGPNGAAKLLDLNPSTLRFRMKRLGIKRSD